MLQPTKNKPAIILTSIFIACEIAFFIILNFTSIPASIPSFCSIVLCFVFVIFFDVRKQDINLLQIALFFTMISDMFLILFRGFQVIAMISFTIVQITYAVRLLNYSDSKKENIINLCLRVILTILVEILVLAVFLKSFDWLLFICSIYATNFLVNIVFSFIHIRSNFIFPFALVLFLICDFFVAIDCASPYIDLSGNAFFAKIFALPFSLAWVFYLPAQVLLALSLFTTKKKTLQ